MHITHGCVLNIICMYISVESVVIEVTTYKSLCNPSTVVWKMLVWDYFIVENV